MLSAQLQALHVVVQGVRADGCWWWGVQEREEERERSTTCQWQLNPKSRELLAAKGRLSQDGDIVSRLMEHGTQQRLKVSCSLATDESTHQA